MNAAPEPAAAPPAPPPPLSPPAPKSHYRRSLAVTSLVVIAAATALNLSEEEDACQKARRLSVPVVATPENCSALAPELDCVELFAQGRKDHAAVAPRYPKLENCLEIYGPKTCVADPDATEQKFMPQMVGLLLGQTLSSAGEAWPRATPVYRDRHRILHTGVTPLTGRRSPIALSDSFCETTTRRHASSTYSERDHRQDSADASHSQRSRGGFGATGGHASTSGG